MAVATAFVALAALALAGTALAAEVVLAPASSTHIVGESATLTVTLTNSGQAQSGYPVTFTVTSGPNAGTSQQATTDAKGQATFTYSSSKTGTDHVSAFVPRFETTSNDATVTWNAPPPPVPPKTDVQLTLKAPSLAHVGENATWTATMTNAGPDTATGITFRASTSPAATLVSATESRGNGCTGSTCAVGTLAAGASATVTLVYTPAQPGTLSVSGSVESDFDTNTANNSASAATTVVPAGGPPPPPPPPSQPGTFNAIPTGTVRVNGSDQPADQQFVLHSGDTVDVTDGIITFTTADGSTGNFSSSQPTSRRALASRSASLPAQFTVEQSASGGVPTLALAGGDFSACSSSRSLAVNKKPIRQLWGSAKGNFRTRGRYASATVRGTIWLVQDRCDGTLTQVVEGVVDVLDATRHRTVAVNAGASYLAAPRPALKVPSQTAAKVKARGLVYGGRTYKTKAAFTKRLKAVGYTWAEFAKKYPGLAKALAKRR
ncbi:MAG TPA: Ig-like domain-containing protein [Gaiellaceae bacterium]